jgi:GDP-D-mannose dehydratase
MKSAIFGAGGQDGRILAEQIEARNEKLIRVNRGAAGAPSGRSAWGGILQEEKPDRIYYLAAHHRSSEDKAPDAAKEWIQSFQVHLEGWIHVLDFVRKYLPQCHLLYASSAHVFGAPLTSPQNENTQIAPSCAYGCSKLAGMEAGRFFRAEYRLHVSHVILFPHESITGAPLFFP